MQFELLGVFITVLIALLGFAYGYGVINTKVKANKDNITDIWKEISDFKKENKADHNSMSNKLDTIIRNGRKSSE